MMLAERLREFISACFTGVWIESHEHPDALAEIAGLCRQENWQLATWDIERGLSVAREAGADPAGGQDPLAAIRSLAAMASADGAARTTRQTRNARKLN